MSVLINNFSAGKLSKRLTYRTDFEKRGSGVEELINAEVLTQGGIQKRSPTELLICSYNYTYKGQTKIMGDITKTFPFQSASTNDDYQLVIFDSKNIYVMDTITGDMLFVEDFTKHIFINTYGDSRIGAFVPTDYLTVNDLLIIIFNNAEPLALKRTNSGFLLQRYNYKPALGEDNYDSNMWQTMSVPSSVVDYGIFTYRKPDGTFYCPKGLVLKVAGTDIHHGKGYGNIIKTMCNFEGGGGYRCFFPTLIHFAGSYQMPRKKIAKVVNGKWVAELTEENKDLMELYEVFCESCYLELSKDRIFPVRIKGVEYTGDECHFVYYWDKFTGSTESTEPLTFSSSLPIPEVELEEIYYPYVTGDRDNGTGGSKFNYIICEEDGVVANRGDNLMNHPAFKRVPTTDPYSTKIPKQPFGFNNSPLQNKNLCLQTNKSGRKIDKHWGHNATVKETISLGKVLGNFQIRTTGIWTGTMRVERNDGTGWELYKELSSLADSNSILNDEREYFYDVEYQVVCDFQTASSASAYTRILFTCDNSDIYITSQFGDHMERPIKVASKFFSYPESMNGSSVEFFQNRIWFSKDSDVYASEVNNFSNFSNYGGVDVSHPMKFRVADTRSSPIQWLTVSGKDLMIGTSTAQWSLSSKDGVAISPETARCVKQSNYAACSQKPVDSGVEFIYVDGSKKRLYASKYEYSLEVYNSTEISLLNNTDYDNGIVKIEWDGIKRVVYSVLANGKLIALKYDDQQNIMACYELKFNLDFLKYPTYYGVRDIVCFHGSNGKSESFVFLTNSRDTNLVVLKMSGSSYVNKVKGDCYMTKAKSSFDISRFDNKETECYLMTTSLKGDIVEKKKYNIKEKIENWKKDDYLSITLPINMYFKTLPIEFGSAFESTFNDKKNISSIKLIASNWAEIDFSFSDVSYNNFKSEQKETCLTYDKDDFNKYGSAKSGIVETYVQSGWKDILKMTVRESGPYTTVIDGYYVDYKTSGR